MGELRVAVLGPGGVGGLLAALLAREGAEVTCIASELSAAAIRQRGLSLTSDRFGSFSVKVSAESSLSHEVDVLLVTVKEVDLAAALERIPTPVLNGAVVVPFLNGIDHLQALRERFPEAEVVAATIRVESSRVGPGDIHQVSPFTVIEVAPNDATPKLLADLCALFDASGIDVHERSDERAILWGKLSFLAPLALLTTDHAAAVGVIRTAHRVELLRVVGEVAAVARAEGVPVDEAAVTALLDGVPQAMQSSMQRDLASGRPIEIEAIGGTIVRHAHAHSIAVPEVERIVTDLRVRSRSTQP
jgi:2-dehydropantoate 2-reductase